MRKKEIHEIAHSKVNFDNMQVKTDSNGSSEEQNLAFQLLDDEVMDKRMSNFIGIHKMSDVVANQEIK